MLMAADARIDLHAARGQLVCACTAHLHQTVRDLPRVPASGASVTSRGRAESGLVSDHPHFFSIDDLRSARASANRTGTVCASTREEACFTGGPAACRAREGGRALT